MEKKNVEVQKIFTGSPDGTIVDHKAGFTENPDMTSVDRQIIITITQSPPLAAIAKRLHNTNVSIETVTNDWKFQYNNRGIVVSAVEIRAIVQFVRKEYYKLTKNDLLKDLVDLPENQ